MELLIIYHVFFSEDSVFFKLLCAKILSIERTSSLHYFNSEMHFEYFGIKTTRELIA